MMMIEQLRILSNCRGASSSKSCRNHRPSIWSWNAPPPIVPLIQQCIFPLAGRFARTRSLQTTMSPLLAKSIHLNLPLLQPPSNHRTRRAGRRRRMAAGEARRSTAELIQRLDSARDPGATGPFVTTVACFA